MAKCPRHPPRVVKLHSSAPEVRLLNALRKGPIPLYEITSCYPITFRRLKILEKARVVTMPEVAEA